MLVGIFYYPLSLVRIFYPVSKSHISLVLEDPTNWVLDFYERQSWSWLPLGAWLGSTLWQLFLLSFSFLFPFPIPFLYFFIERVFKLKKYIYLKLIRAPKTSGWNHFRPVSHIGFPWQLFLILQALQCCMGWARAPGVIRLIFLQQIQKCVKAYCLGWYMVHTNLRDFLGLFCTIKEELDLVKSVSLDISYCSGNTTKI